MKSEILTLLREGMRRGNAQDGSQEYISGQELWQPVRRFPHRCMEGDEPAEGGGL